LNALDETPFVSSLQSIISPALKLPQVQEKKKKKIEICQMVNQNAMLYPLICPGLVVPASVEIVIVDLRP
jgi:hypothetical protein